VELASMVSLARIWALLRSTQTSPVMFRRRQPVLLLAGCPLPALDPAIAERCFRKHLMINPNSRGLPVPSFSLQGVENCFGQCVIRCRSSKTTSASARLYRLQPWPVISAKNTLLPSHRPLLPQCRRIPPYPPYMKRRYSQKQSLSPASAVHPNCL